MDHMTLGQLRELLAHHKDKPDSFEVRIFLEHGDEYEPTFGELSGVLSSREEDSFIAYLGLSISDTGSL